MTFVRRISLSEQFVDCFWLTITNDGTFLFRRFRFRRVSDSQGAAF